MNTIGLWQIAEKGPARLRLTEISAERHLEDWIEHDPSLLEQGLVIVGRQIRMEGGPLDLLALDPQGRWVLIEIKRERLRREVIAQAIDYASCVSGLDPAKLKAECDSYLRSRGSESTLEVLMEQRGREVETDERDVTIYLVGTGIAPGLERMARFLVDRANLSLRLVTISAFQDENGNVLLAREIHEAAAEQTADGSKTQLRPSPTIDQVLARADQNGVGEVARVLYNVANELGLHVRPWAKSIMVAPPENRTRCLFVLSVNKTNESGSGKVYVSSECFTQFYGINEDDLATALAVPVSENVLIDKAEAERFADGLRKLMSAH